MSEYISDNANMSNGQSSNLNSDNISSSPTKNWVQFDDGAGSEGPQKSMSADGTPIRNPGSSSQTTTSGVSSARGSVNSLPQQSHTNGKVLSSPEGAQLSVSEIQVVDEKSLKKQVATANSNVGTISSDQRTMQMMVNGNSSSVNRRLSNTPGVNESMDNVNLSDNEAVTSTQPHQIRGKHFTNGEVIVTLLPTNEKLPWIMPAKFRPELVPEELMAPVLTLTVEEYVQTMEKLTTDMRFTLFNICYKRILIIWITLAFVILLSLLFSGFVGIQLFGCGVAWLILNAAAIFVCMWIKLKLNKQMELCMSFINSGLLKHNIILGLDDRGKISCQKVNLCFIYFDPTECIKKLESILEEKQEENFDREAYLKNDEQFEDIEIVVPGRTVSKVNRKHERAEKLYLHYIQRWAKDYLRRRLDWIVDDLYGRQEYASNTNPRHLNSALCPCQYIEEHLRNKRQRESLNPCATSANPCLWCD